MRSKNVMDKEKYLADPRFKGIEVFKIGILVIWMI